MKKLAPFIFVALLLTACNAPVVGKVVGHDHDKAYTRTYQSTERYSCGTERYFLTTGKVTTRHTRMKYCNRPVTKTERVPEDWDILVQDEQGKTHEVNVSFAEYHTYKRGDRYPKMPK